MHPYADTPGKNGHCTHRGESAQYLMAQAYRADGSGRPTPNHLHAFQDRSSARVSGLSEQGLIGHINKNPKSPSGIFLSRPNRL
jgi:hypothetical protein